MTARTRNTLAACVAVALVAIAAVVLILHGGRGTGDDSRSPSPSATPERTAADEPDHAPVEPPRLPSSATSTPALQLMSATVSDANDAPAGRFGGRVVNWSTGAGVGGASVTFSVDGATTSVTTDASGAFRFDPPEPGEYRLAVVNADGYLPFAPELDQSPIALTARPNRAVGDITLYLRPAIEYRGLVLTRGGAPVPGASVRLIDASSGEQSLVPIESEFSTDAAGAFTFNAPDGAFLVAEHPEHGRGMGRVDGDVQITHRITIELSGEAAGSVARDESLSGRVVDTGGQPIEGAQIRAAVVGVPMSEDVMVTATGADGAFSFTGVPAGRYGVEASHDDFAPAVARTTTGETGLVIEMTAGAILTGSVVSSAGADPVGAFTIAVLRRVGVARMPERTVTVFDPNGAFRVRGLPPGDYIVVASAYGLAPSDEVDVSLEAGEPSSVTLRLTAGGAITGVVTSARTSAPLELARVSVEGYMGSGSSATPLTTSVVTDAEGRFELRGVAPGRTSITVAAFEHNPKIVPAIDVVEGAVAGPVDVELTPTAEGEQPRIETAGIGVAVRAGEDGVTIDRVIPEGGAADAGLAVGDTIIEVDGVAVATLGFNGSLQRIRGPEGTTVQLTVRRENGESYGVEVVRKKIRV